MSFRHVAVGGARAVVPAAALAALLTVLLAAPAARAEEEARRGFWVPGAFLSVETRSASDVLAALSEMLDAVKPGLVGVLRTQLAQGLEVGGADALDALGGDRPAGLLVLNPRRQEGHVVVAVGDAGVQAVFRAIGGAMGQEVDEDLLEFGDFVIGDREVVLYFRHSAPWVLCSLAPTAIDAAEKALKEGRVPRAPARRAHLAAHLDMKELRAAYGDVVLGSLQIARTGIAAGGMQMQGPGAPPQFAFGILKEYINAAEAVFQGFDEIDLSVRISRDAVEIDSAALPAEDGVFAPLAEATEPATFAPAFALPGGGTFVLAWRADARATRRLVDAIARSLVRIVTNADHLDETDEETNAKIEPYRRLIGVLMTGEAASSVVADGNGMTSVQAMDADFDTVREIYGEIMEVVAAEFAPLFQGMGMTMRQRYQKSARQLPDGGRVDRMTTTLELQGMMADQMRGMFDFMFGGEEQVTEIGDTGAGTVIGWGRNSAKVLDEAVARQNAADDYAGAAWPTASKELVRALERARGVTTAAFEVRIASYLAMVFSMVRAQPGMDAILPIDNEEIENLVKKDVPVVGWAGVEKGRLVLHERVPTAAVKNLVEFFEKMQQRFGGGRGPRDDWGPEPLPGDPVEVW